MKADKKWNIEKKINEMIDKAKETKLDIMGYKSTYILFKLDEIQLNLDDQSNTLGMMKSNPFIKAVQNKANGLENKLLLIQETLDQWVVCQRGWMYLEPIFNSEDIKAKMPKEYQKFVLIDKSWRTNMEQFHKDNYLYDQIDSDKLQQEFKNNNKCLEEIQKSLA